MVEHVSAGAGRDSPLHCDCSWCPPKLECPQAVLSLGSAGDRGAEQEPRGTAPFWDIAKLGPFCNPGLASHGNWWVLLGGFGLENTSLGDKVALESLQ